MCVCACVCHELTLTADVRREVTVCLYVILGVMVHQHVFHGIEVYNINIKRLQSCMSDIHTLDRLL